MTLWDFLGTCQCTQELYIYLVNDYGEYLPVYHGMKGDIDFWGDGVFDILQNKIEVFVVLPDGSVQVEVRDTYFDKPMREQYKTCKEDKLNYWEKHPDEAPWGDWTDTEAYCQIVRRESRWFHDIIPIDIRKEK